MIAAQLLAYYFTELKDDQLKKVSEISFEIPQWSFCTGRGSCVMWQQPIGWLQTLVIIRIEPWGHIWLREDDAGFWSYRMRRRPWWILIWISALICSVVSSIWYGCPWEGLWSGIVEMCCRQIAHHWVFPEHSLPWRPKQTGVWRRVSKSQELYDLLHP